MQPPQAAGGRRVADEVDHDRFAGGLRGGEEPGGHGGRGRLGHEHDHFRSRVAGQQVQRLVGGDGADLCLEVAPAGAKGLRHAAAQVVDFGRDGLEAGAGGAHYADGAAPHPVGKAQAHAIDDGRAAVGAHHEQSLRLGGLLEGHLVIQRDIVAVEKDVLAQVHRLARHAGGVAPRRRHQHPAGLGQVPGGGGEALGPEVLAGAGAALLEQRIHLPQRGGGGGLGLAFNDDQQVIGAGAGGLVVQAALVQQLAVGGRGHHHTGIGDARQLGQGALQAHEHG